MIFNILFVILYGILFTSICIIIEENLSMDSKYFTYYLIGCVFAFCIRLLDVKENKQ